MDPSRAACVPRIFDPRCLTTARESAACEPAAVVYARMNWRHMNERLAAGSAASFELINTCVWQALRLGIVQW